MADHAPLPVYGPHIPRFVQRFGWPLPRLAGGSPDAPEGSAPTPDKDEPKLTQKQVDAIVQDRLAREREKFPDYDTLKEKAGKFDQQEAEGQSELERANAKIADLETQVTTLTGERDTARGDLTDLQVEAQIRAALPKEIVDADAALALLKRDKVTVGDDGQVTGHEDAIKALVESKPYLVGETPTQPSGVRDGGAQAAGSPSAEGVSPGLGRMAAAYGQSSTTT